MKPARKQAILNTIITYAGIVLGALNFLILYPAFFQADEIGLIKLLGSVSLIYYVVSLLGLPQSYQREFQTSRHNPRQAGSLASWYLLLVAAIAAVTSLAFIALKGPIVAAYQENSALFVDYYWLIIPFSFFQTAIFLFEAFGMVHHKTVFSAFIKDILIRLLTILSIVLYIAGVLSFSAFVHAYVLLHGIAALAMLWWVWRYRLWGKPASLRHFPKTDVRRFITYGAFGTLSSASIIIATTLDALMVGSMLSLKLVGVYGIFTYTASVILVPYRSVVRTATPLMYQYWKDDDRKSLQSLYASTGILVTVAALWIFLGIWTNRLTMLHLLKAPIYAENYTIFIWLGLTSVINCMFGVNHYLLSSSSSYRLDLYINIFSVILSIITNYFFIQWYNAAGAAIATLLSMFIINIIKWGYLKWKYRLEVFSKQYLLLVPVAALCVLLDYVLPPMPHFIIDVAVRSTLLTVLFFTCVYFLNISAILNGLILKTVRKINKRLG